ncbi:beta-lactamase family protein [bacterium]|nr:beta-lactamase family protein [bacterium]MBU1984831.1 beta-lactamase family protein [bacterium]
MKHRLSQATLDQIVSAAVAKKHIYGAVFHVSSHDHHINLISASGNIKENSRYYIASVNKLFVSALVLRLCMDGKLNLTDRIATHLPEDVVAGMHRHNGTDYSRDLTVQHLMSLTSGLPCYLADRQADGKRAMSELEAGMDEAWPMERVIHEVKKMKSHFPPGQNCKARYGDTNHQILSLVIERVTGEPVNIVLIKLFQELQMTDTFVYDNADERKFVPICYRSETRHLPLFLASTRNDIISTARDQMTFLRAFFGGHFFPKEKLKELKRWNNIFFPFQYGIGIQKFHLPRVLSPFRTVPEMLGHCGSTGSVAFYVPDRNLFITGTVNQQTRPNVAFQTMIKIVNTPR